MPGFDDAVGRSLQLEGGFVDDPQDPGGATNWGITIGVFHQWAQAVLGIPGSRENLESLPRENAVRIYKARYWDPMRLDEVAAIDEAVARELFDTGVNMGEATAVKMLQRLLNALNNRGSYYKDLKVDGDLGNKTLTALRAYAGRRKAEGLRVLVTGLNCLQGARYVDIVERTPASEKFFYGWLKQRVAD